MSWKRQKIIEFCKKNGNRITKKDAMSLIDDYYCNGEKHVGEVLSRLVKSGVLERIKPGLFKIAEGNFRASFTKPGELFHEINKEQ